MPFVTPTYARDFARLHLLRESMERFEVTEDHILIVDDVDVVQAIREFTGPRVVIVPISQINPGLSVHLHRLPKPVKKKIHAGWWIQQLAKLNVGRVLGLDEWYCLDSDNFFIDTVTREHFHAPDGRLFLLERLNASVGRHVIKFNGNSARLLKLDPSAATVDQVYTANCVPLHGGVVDELLTWLEDTYRGPWWLNMCARQGTEYAMYGQFARHRHGLRDVVPTSHYMSADIYSRLPLQEAVESIVAQAEGKRLAMLHGWLDYSIDDARTIANDVWTALGRG